MGCSRAKLERGKVKGERILADAEAGGPAAAWKKLEMRFAMRSTFVLLGGSTTDVSVMCPASHLVSIVRFGNNQRFRCLVSTDNPVVVTQA